MKHSKETNVPSKPYDSYKSKDVKSPLRDSMTKKGDTSQAPK